MSRHTPGPWRQKPTNDFFNIQIIAGKQIVCTVNANDKDASLIAAATEMLDALYKAREFIRNVDLEFQKQYLDAEASEAFSAVDKAIKKAEGKRQ